jgi:hypothetical protein
MKKTIYSILMTLCCLAVTTTAQAATFTFTITNVTKKNTADATYCKPVQIKVINKETTIITNGTKYMEPGAVETITTNDANACTSIELSANCGWTRASLTTGCSGGSIAIVTPYAMIQL